MRRVWLLMFGGLLIAGTLLNSCNTPGQGKSNKDQDQGIVADQQAEQPFEYVADRFADIQVLRYKVPGFDQLSLDQKKLIYFLYEAALSGRDIIYDQNYKYNLLVRKTIEAIVTDFKGDRSTDEYKNFMVYAKRFWFSNGIHHHYSTMKMRPDFSREFLTELIYNVSTSELLPRKDGETLEDFNYKIADILFSDDAMKRVSKNPETDMIASSANNFYEGLTQQEVEEYHKAIMIKGDTNPISYGLNSKLSKNEKGEIVEKVWKAGGMYTKSIEQIVFWLRKASKVAENKEQKAALDKLIAYYNSGDLQDFDEYNIAWVKDTASVVDVINGFIEVYGDPLGFRGSFESLVSFKDMEATKRIAAISQNAQWFEDNAPIMDEHKKKSVKGISAKVITVVAEAGDASPATPIGINLPNSNWIRKDHGSKSVNLGNIVNAYAEANKSGGSLEEFAYSEEEIKRAKKWGVLADNLHTDMHEVIGHASGQLNDGIGTPKETLRNYASTLEEARADLVGLYFVYDQKLVDIGVMPSLEVGMVAYDDYITNGLLQQLRRISPGEDIEEDHMRNRQLIAKWVYEKGQPENVIEKKVKDGKTYFVVNDYDKLKVLFGQLLREIQRIKSEGDYESGKNLVENYGVKVDPELHREVLTRYEKLDIASYSGFIQPKLVPVKKDGEIVDVKIEYPDDFVDQMLYYGKHYGYLPVEN